MNILDFHLNNLQNNATEQSVSESATNIELHDNLLTAESLDDFSARLDKQGVLNGLHLEHGCLVGESMDDFSARLNRSDDAVSFPDIDPISGLSYRDIPKFNPKYASDYAPYNAIRQSDNGLWGGSHRVSFTNSIGSSLNATRYSEESDIPSEKKGFFRGGSDFDQEWSDAELFNDEPADINASNSVVDGSATYFTNVILDDGSVQQIGITEYSTYWQNQPADVMELDIDGVPGADITAYTIHNDNGSTVMQVDYGNDGHIDMCYIDTNGDNVIEIIGEDLLGNDGVLDTFYDASKLDLTF